nr:ADP-ribosylation factor GTPase-activating protein AGD10 [Tanacetum cinerariifolium]
MLSCLHRLLLLKKTSDGPFDFKAIETPKENFSAKPDTNGSALVKASRIHTATVKNRIGSKKPRNTRGLGAKKLSTKTCESLYDHKPEETHQVHDKRGDDVS